MKNEVHDKVSDICPRCGLPLEICACEALEKSETRKIKAYETKKKFHKLVTIVEGIEPKDLEKAAKGLKQKLACGGTAKDGIIVLQGGHREKIRAALVSIGYPADIIDVV